MPKRVERRGKPDLGYFCIRGEEHDIGIHDYLLNAIPPPGVRSVVLRRPVLTINTYIQSRVNHERVRN
jgi:hypothetical protein